MDSTLDHGRYAVLARVGQGGSADVYSVVDEKFAVERAIKIPREVPAAAEATRVKREAEVLARLDHPGILRIFDTFAHAERTCIVMERCVETLEERVQRNGPLPVATAVALGEHLASALDAAHAAGVLHRDVKPANVLFTPSGTARLGDFGVALIERDPGSLTRTGALLGTVAFMAPAVRRGEPASEASDRYGLAATIVFAVLGRLPGDVDRITVQRGLPPSVLSFVHRMLQQRSGEATAQDPTPRGALRLRPPSWLGLGLGLGLGLIVLAGQALRPPTGDAATPSGLPRCDAFPEHFNLVQAQGAREVLAADFVDVTQDGWLDAVYVSQGDNRLHVFPGGPGASLDRRIDIEVGRASVPPTMLDLDDDGRAELVLPERDDARIRVLWLDEDLQPTQTRLFEQAGPMEEPQVVDVDMDGRPDLVGRIAFGLHTVWRRVPGDGTLEPMRYLLNTPAIETRHLVGLDVVVREADRWTWRRLTPAGGLSEVLPLPGESKLLQLPGLKAAWTGSFRVLTSDGAPPCSHSALSKWVGSGGRLGPTFADWDADGRLDWVGTRTCRGCTSELVVGRGL